MQESAIAFMAIKTVFWIESVIDIHYSIADNFGKDRGAGDRKAFRVTPDYPFARNINF